MCVCVLQRLHVELAATRGRLDGERSQNQEKHACIENLKTQMADVHRTSLNITLGAREQGVDPHDIEMMRDTQQIFSQIKHLMSSP